jgi:multidrug efflux pump subunit AcrB
MLNLVATLCFAVQLFISLPKGYRPDQDNGLIWGGIQADQSISFQLMRKKLTQFVEIIRQDPAVAKVAGYYGGGSYGSAFVVLKPLSERRESAEEVTNRLRPKLDQIAGAALYLGADQDVRFAGQTGNSGYQYTLLGEDSTELYEWAPKVADALKHLPLLTDVNFDQQQGGPEANLIIDRATAARLGLTVGQVDKHPLRRLWAAAGIGDLQGAKPVPRRDGGGARVPAIAGHIEPDLCQHRRRRGQRYTANPTVVRHRSGQAAVREERQHRRERGAEHRRRGPQRGQQCARQ